MSVELNGRGVELTPGSSAASFVFASLPSGALGMMATVTDSDTATWGEIIAGGGSNVVLAWFNGSDWTVVGK